MKALLDINHPAHVHFFRHLISELQLKGWQVTVTASLKDIALDLLELYNIPYINLGTYGNTQVQKALSVPVMALKMLNVVRKEKPDVMLAIGSRITHAGFLSGVPSFVFTDTEHATEQIALFKPFATRIYTPDCFTSELGPKQVRYPSYHELAYLHPKRFQADASVLERYGLKANERFFLLRFVSWNASHDIGQKGMSGSEKTALTNYLSQFGKVIISAECELPEELKPYQMTIPIHYIHHLLAFASIYIGEGGTMASEAAVLGTPAIFTSTLTAGTFQELEKKFGLFYSVKNFKDCHALVEQMLANPDLKNTWQAKRQEMLNSKIDMTDYMLNAIETYKP